MTLGRLAHTGRFSLSRYCSNVITRTSPYSVLISCCACTPLGDPRHKNAKQASARSAFRKAMRLPVEEPRQDCLQYASHRGDGHVRTRWVESFQVKAHENAVRVLNISAIRIAVGKAVALIQSVRRVEGLH